MCRLQIIFKKNRAGTAKVIKILIKVLSRGLRA